MDEEENTTQAAWDQQQQDEREQREMSRAEIFSALAKAQAEIKGAIKDSSNPFFKSKYADLAACFDAIKKPFADNGLAVIQMPMRDDSGMYIVTMITHSSGEYIQDGGVPVKPTKDDPQGMGSAMTYARRYGLTAMTGLPQIDDDGNAASKPADKMPEAQAKKIGKLLDAANIETGEGCAAFAEAWVELSEAEKLSFSPWISSLWPGKVMKIKEQMRDAIAVWRSESEAAA